MRVLVVDDDPLTSYSLARLFAIRRVEVVSVATVKTAEERLECEQFDAVVVDAQVDQAKGLRVLAKARLVDARIALFLLGDTAPEGREVSDIYHIEKPWDGFFVVDIVRARCGGEVSRKERGKPTVQDERPTVELRPMRLRTARDSAVP